MRHLWPVICQLGEVVSYGSFLGIGWSLIFLCYYSFYFFVLRFLNLFLSVSFFLKLWTIIYISIIAVFFQYFYYSYLLWLQFMYCLTSQQQLSDKIWFMQLDCTKVDLRSQITESLVSESWTVYSITLFLSKLYSCLQNAQWIRSAFS